jgi:DNA-binding SARP family transcriptional activator
MEGLAVRLFGKVRVEWEGQPVTSLPAKSLEMLCYMLVYRDRSHTRETLAGVLWPEASYSLSKKYLRQTLWQLQGAMRQGAAKANGHGPVPALLLLSSGWVRLDPAARWWLDVHEFEAAFAACRDTPGERLSDPQARALEAAVALYQGDLIEAGYQDWCVYERERLQLAYLMMLEKLMGWCEARRAYAPGLAYGLRILRRDPARECTHRQLMRLHYRAGDRTTALRQYERCAAALAREFNLTPSEETVALYHQLRAGRLEDPPAPPVRPDEPAPGAPAARGSPEAARAVELLAQLDRVLAGVSALQEEVRRLTAIGEAVADNLQTARQTLQETS